jgi:hypothetical protein
MKIRKKSNLFSLPPWLGGRVGDRGTENKKINLNFKNFLIQFKKLDIEFVFVRTQFLFFMKFLIRKNE